MKSLLTFLLAVLSSCIIPAALRAQSDKPVISDDSISEIVKKLTLEEKVAMVHANSLFSSAGVKRLGIPDLVCDDGPLGVREDVLAHWQPANRPTDSATFFPNGSALAATWDPGLAWRYGHDLGQEARARGKDIILAPAFNITRTPLNGRTYEYYSEDPFLNARLTVAAVKGIQGQGVAACIKHFAVNNQETDRGRVDVAVDERTLREIYLPSFRAAVMEANAWTIMSAYNKLRGVYCSENAYLLDSLLRQEWGFRGVVISDWGGTHSTVEAANRGLDLEMGSGELYNKYFFADSLLAAVKTGRVNEAVLDDKVTRILRLIYKTSLGANASAGSINTPAHSKTAYDIAAESIVLLKNEGQLLPLHLGEKSSVAIIGDNAIHRFQGGGFGAGVKAKYEVTALEGLKNRLPSTVSVQFAQGYTAMVRRGRGTAAKADTTGSAAKLIAEAVDLAKRSDIALLFVGGNRDYESESWDRKDLSLPFGEQALIEAVTAVNPKTIIIVVGGAPYDLSAIQQKHPAILWSWYNGSENGNALADVLTGKVNPSGKLPFTFPVALSDGPAHGGGAEAYPGVNLRETYKEGILVGYRWYDTKKIKPLYPFGYGLSYSTWSLSNMRVGPSSASDDSISVNVRLKNTGRYDGKQTVQLYAAKKDSKVERAEKELKGFKKVFVPAGGMVDVRIDVSKKDLAYFDTGTAKWVVEPGMYVILVGTSSRDIDAIAQSVNIPQ